MESPTIDKPYKVEYYYKTKWGHADEFIRLFKKNHYPVLKKQIAMGRILQVAVATPRFHNTEDGRWDYRVTLTFKNAQTAFGEFDSEPINKELYPDQETFKKEEQRRFEILLGTLGSPHQPAGSREEVTKFFISPSLVPASLSRATR